MRWIGGIALWGLVCGLLASPVGGQQLEQGSGVWVGGGLGVGWGRVSCEFCRNERHAGPVGHVRLSMRVNPRFVVGAEASGWTNNLEEDEVREFIGGLQGVTYFYPRPAPWYLKAGIGWMGYGAEEVSSKGIGVQLGAGYEFRVPGNLTMSNFVNLAATSFAKLRSEDETLADESSITLLQIGVAVTRR